MLLLGTLAQATTNRLDQEVRVNYISGELADVGRSNDLPRVGDPFPGTNGSPNGSHVLGCVLQSGAAERSDAPDSQISKEWYILAETPNPTPEDRPPNPTEQEYVPGTVRQIEGGIFVSDSQITWRDFFNVLSVLFRN